MVGATQAPLTLGGGLGIPSFPTTFSNINPQPATSPIRFGAGGTAEMGVGGANVRYHSNLGIAGGQYGPLEMGARDFSPARLPQAQSPSMFGTVPFTPFTPRAERMAPALSTGLTPLPIEPSMPIEEGPVSLRRENAIALPQTATQRGLERVENPYGYAYLTSQQKQNLAAAEARDVAEAERAKRYESALVRARQIGAQNTKATQEESLRRSADFFARINAERSAREFAKAQEEQMRGGSGKDALRRAEQFQVRSQLESQRAANVGTGQKTPFFSWEPITTRGGAQYLPSGMGEFTRIPSDAFAAINPRTRGGPQPATALPRPSTGGPSTMDIGSSPISYTDFFKRQNEQPSPLFGFMSSIRPTPINPAFRPLPFGMRNFGTA